MKEPTMYRSAKTIKDVLTPEQRSEDQRFLIFVVDGERIIASTLASILKTHGFDVRYFVDPLEALRIAWAETPDLLILDVMMLEIAGLNLATRLKALCPDCKMLLFSGKARTADLLKQARSEGHDFNFVRKQVHPADLLAHRRASRVDAGGKTYLKLIP